MFRLPPCAFNLRPWIESSDNLPRLFVYRLLSVFALLAYFPYALLASLTGRRRLGDIWGRLGRRDYPDLETGIWVHAVSVGEVGVARTLLAMVSEKAPGRRLGLSVTTVAGRELAQRLLPGEVALLSFPLDLKGPVDRALATVRPGLILLTETELWPLFLSRAKALAIPVALVNGRISPRSFRRYRLVRPWFGRVLEGISFFAMQTEADAERVVALGAPRQRIRVTGNIKYDLPPAPAFADGARLHEAAKGRPVLVAASTGEGEEQIVLEAWKELSPRPFLALAPRRPERFDEVARLVQWQGFRLLRRSQAADAQTRHPQSTIRDSPDIYLLDSIGELASLYREARLAFLGGSFVPTGGHNPIEAWAEGVPVIVGPHTENFQEVCRQGERLDFLRRVPDGQALRREVAEALAEPVATAKRGERAKSFVLENRGAARATLEGVLPLLSSNAGKRAIVP